MVEKIQKNHQSHAPQLVIGCLFFSLGHLFDTLPVCDSTIHSFLTLVPLPDPIVRVQLSGLQLGSINNSNTTTTTISNSHTLPF
ncbi:hypothetical protein BDV12DRAFT_6190 [Aspergillus spectabilis]